MARISDQTCTTGKPNGERQPHPNSCPENSKRGQYVADHLCQTVQELWPWLQGTEVESAELRHPPTLIRTLPARAPCEPTGKRCEEQTTKHRLHCDCLTLPLDIPTTAKQPHNAGTLRNACCHKRLPQNNLAARGWNPNQMLWNYKQTSMYIRFKWRCHRATMTYSA